MSKKALKEALKIKDSDEIPSFSRKALRGEKTEEEIKVLLLLTAWHNNAKKKKNFSGVLK